MNTITVKDWMNLALDRADRSSDVKTKVDEEGKYIRTPGPLCEEIVSEVARAVSKIVSRDPEDAYLYEDALRGKKILVVDTVEFIPVLLTFGAEKSNIVYVAPYKYKSAIADRLGVRVVQQSLLEWETTMKFDVVIGNPPYQDGNEAIWKKVADKCLGMSDIVALVTPRNIVNGVQTQKGSTGGFFGELKSGLTYIDFNADNYFNVGKRICGWIYDRNHKDTTTIKTSAQEYTQINIRPYGYLPYNFSSLLDFSIFEKIEKSSKMKEFKDVKSRPAGPYLVAPAIKHISLNFVIVVEDLSIDTRVTAKDIIGYQLNDNEVIGCRAYRETKFFRYVFHLFGGVDVRAGVFRKFPRIDFTRAWTDQELYAHFGLTQEEIDYIEATVK